MEINNWSGIISAFSIWVLWIVFWAFVMSYLVPIIRCRIGNHYFPVVMNRVWNGRKYICTKKCYRCGKIKIYDDNPKERILGVE